MSSTLAKKYHSITIGTKNTWDDWHLIPASRPLVNPPPVKTSYVDVPGSDGVLDLTTALSGRANYSNRTGSWQFYVENGFKSWSSLYSEIMIFLHGQKKTVVLDDDAEYAYEGRLSVNQWRSDPASSSIVIDYNLDPYKKSITATEQWEWDTFEFATGVIRYYKDLVVKNSLTINVIGDSTSSTPTLITTADGMTVTFEGNTYNLSKGANTIRAIVLKSGNNSFRFTGNGNVSFRIVGGML